MTVRRAVLLIVAIVLSVSAPAHAGHGTRRFERAGRVLVPTAGFPIVFGVMAACDPDHAFQGVGGYSIRLPADTWAHEYRIRTSPLMDLDVVFLRGPQGTSCVGMTYARPPTGPVPIGANWAYVVMNVGAAADFTFEITGLD